MSVELKPRTAELNGRLWGARASDWAEIQESAMRPVYEAVLERTRVGSGTRYLDVGCGAGMAAQIAAARGAQVSAIDAAEALRIGLELRAADGFETACDRAREIGQRETQRLRADIDADEARTVRQHVCKSFNVQDHRRRRGLHGSVSRGGFIARHSGLIPSLRAARQAPARDPMPARTR